MSTVPAACAGTVLYRPEDVDSLIEQAAALPAYESTTRHVSDQTMLAAGVQATQILGTVFDGITRHTKEGYAFQQRAAEAGFKQAVRERDEPFGDFGPSTFKG